MLRPPSSVLGTAPSWRAPLLSMSGPLHRLPPTPYWCAQAEAIYPPGHAEDPPPPLVLADRATFTAASRRLQEPRLEFAWDLVATHDPDALAFADRVLRLADGELTERAP